MAHEYLLGDRPCLADFAMMGPLYAHLYRDPVPGKLVRTRAPLVGMWIEKVMGHPRAELHGPHPTDRTLLPLTAESGGSGGMWEAVPPTITAVLSHMLAEYVPGLNTIAAMFAEAGFAQDEEVPRALGLMDFELSGVSGKRGAGELPENNCLEGPKTECSDRCRDLRPLDGAALLR